MKISTKITLGTTALFGLVFFLAAVIIYISFYNGSKRLFYDELARTAKIAGMFYLEEDELSKSQFKPIEKAFYKLNPEQEISIYDDKDSIAFDTKSQNLDLADKLHKIRQKGTLNFQEGEDFYHGLFYRDNQGDFVVLIKAQNLLMQSQLNYLTGILLLAFLCGMTILIVLIPWLSKLAYKPVRQTIKQVNTLNLNQKPLKLTYKSTKDEIEELVQAFNALLHEIEKSYEEQKNFVDYASHEMKTPLTGIINQLEVSLQRNRTLQEHREVEKVALEESIRLQNILKNLLIFSSLNRTVHHKKWIRVDELLWSVIEELSSRYGEEKFKVELSIPAKAFKLLEVEANETLLHMAILNILDNAAKFSPTAAVEMLLKAKDDQLVLVINDKGIGMTEEDLQHITQPFYRAPNAAGYAGNGLGMSISYEILKLHKIQFKISSKPQCGTKIELSFGRYH